MLAAFYVISDQPKDTQQTPLPRSQIPLPHPTTCLPWRPLPFRRLRLRPHPHLHLRRRLVLFSLTNGVLRARATDSSLPWSVSWWPRTVASTSQTGVTTASRSSPPMACLFANGERMVWATVSSIGRLASRWHPTIASTFQILEITHTEVHVRWHVRQQMGYLRNGGERRLK